LQDLPKFNLIGIFGLKIISSGKPDTHPGSHCLPNEAQNELLVDRVWLKNLFPLPSSAAATRLAAIDVLKFCGNLNKLNILKT
jgi:hypothetical protein